MLQIFACSVLIVLAWVACAPQASDPAGFADSRLVVTDSGTVTDSQVRVDSSQEVLDAGSSYDSSAIPDAGPWSEDAGVVYQYGLSCLNDDPITLASCFADAQNRVAALGPAQLQWSRAVAAVDTQGAVTEVNPGLSYTFCYPLDGSFDCVVADYWWGGGTPQISLTRVHRAGVGLPRQLSLAQVPDSPQVMEDFLAVVDCDVANGALASLSRYAEAGEDRLMVISGRDSLVLTDPGMQILDNRCQP